VEEGKVRAIGLVSGGLDSAVAVGLMRSQGVDIYAVNFLNGFSADYMRAEVKGKPISELIEKRERYLAEYFGVSVRVVDVAEEFLKVLLNPEHGYGANVNPCIDCRIFLLRRAREMMEEVGASFVFTGEVLGQRPMSQHRKALDIVEAGSGLQGILLRPLSARLLPPTKMEKGGVIDREKLCDIQGRSRRRQMELITTLGFEGFVQPAGGCILTDENYARKFMEFLSHEGKECFNRAHAVLLTLGRHFRITDGAKIVVGRNKLENDYIEREWAEHKLITTLDVPGPTTLLLGECDDRAVRMAAAVTARYSDGKYEKSVKVLVKDSGRESSFEVEPASDALIDELRI